MVNLKRLSTIVAVALLAGILPLLEITPSHATEFVRLAAYSCSGTSCTCTGDSDCNDMYTKAGCGEGGQCKETGGVTTCSCSKKATLGTPPKTGKGTMRPVGVGGIKQPGDGVTPPKGKGDMTPRSVRGNKSDSSGKN